jgi:hypothetical protein
VGGVLHSFATPAHEPEALHMSPVVQASASSHAVPLAFGAYTQAPASQLPLASKHCAFGGAAHACGPPLHSPAPLHTSSSLQALPSSQATPASSAAKRHTPSAPQTPCALKQPASAGAAHGTFGHVPSQPSGPPQRMKQLGAQHSSATHRCPGGQSAASRQPASTVATSRHAPLSQYCASGHGGEQASTHTRSRHVCEGGQSRLVAHGTETIFAPQLQPMLKTSSPKMSARMGAEGPARSLSD